MGRLNILVTGVGAIIGYGVVNSLRMTGRELNIVGMDIYADAVGQHFCDHFIQAQYADSEDYLEFLIEVIDRFKIDLVFFGTKQELYKVSDARDKFPDYVNRFVLNSRKVIDLSKDKLKTHSFLHQQGIETIPTRLDGSFDYLSKELGIPFILKLRCSYASKGVYLIHDERDFNYWKVKANGDYIIQKLAGDDNHEYTAAIFAQDGKSSCEPFVFRRRLSGEGATAKAEVESIPELSKTIERLVQHLQPVGPTNFQFRFHQGNYLLLEVNPRISSSTSIRAAFGYNEAEMCIQHYVEKRHILPPSLKSGTAVRYISDWISYEDSSNL